MKKRKTKHLILWVDDIDHAAFSAMAKARRKTKAALIRDLLNEGIMSNENSLKEWKIAKASVLSDMALTNA